jgi:hypothetical protein
MERISIDVFHWLAFRGVLALALLTLAWAAAGFCRADRER